jgi:hypothetical protein
MEGRHSIGSRLLCKTHLIIKLQIYLLGEIKKSTKVAKTIGVFTPHLRPLEDGI